MGYSMKMKDAQFTVTVGNASKALEALKEHTAGLKNTFMQVDKIQKATTLTQALDAARFTLEVVHPDVLTLPSKEEIAPDAKSVADSIQALFDKAFEGENNDPEFLELFGKTLKKSKGVADKLSMSHKDKEYITGIYFNGEKFDGTEHEMFNSIAPFVEAGSYIEMLGEGGEIWRWVFDGETCEEKAATITFD